MKHHASQLAAIALAFAFAPLAFAADPPAGGAAGKEATGGGKVAAQDETFMKKAAQIDLAEIQMGELAQKQGQSDAVKAFGQSMITDHTKASEEMKALASTTGITLPTETDAKHKATAEKLAKMEGADFDKAYAAEMVKGHKEAIALFETASKKSKDEGVKAHALKTLPTLQGHLEHAQGLSAAAGGGKDKAGKGKTGDKE